MGENDNPEGNVLPGEASDAQNIAAIADLLDDEPTEDNASEVEDQADPEDEAEDEAQADAEDEDEGEEETGDSDEDEDEDGTEQGDGKFVAKTGRVTMPDGSTTTVADLIQGNMAQSDYSRKTLEVAGQRKQVEQQMAAYNQVFTEVQAQHETVMLAIENLKPQKPQFGPEDDIVGWTKYQAGTEQWDEWDKWSQARRAELQQQQKNLAADAEAQYLTRERDSLLAAKPELRDKDKFDNLLTEGAKVAAQFGYTEEEIFGTKDHRAYLMLDAMVRLTRAMNKAPKAAENVKAKPKMVKGSRRVSQSQQQSRAKRKNFEHLQNEGSLRAGAAALADLDL